MAARHVGDDRGDRVADRVPARSRLRALDPAAARACRTPASASRPWQVGLNVVYFALGHNARHPVHRCVVPLVSRAIASVSGERCVAPWHWPPRRHRAVAFYQGFVDLSFPQPAVLGLHDSRVGNARRSEQARRGGRVLDGRRDRARAPNAAALVDGGDGRGAGDRHRRGLAVAARAPASQRSLSAWRSRRRKASATGVEARDRRASTCKRVAGHRRRRGRAGGRRWSSLLQRRIDAHGRCSAARWTTCRSIGDHGIAQAPTSCCGSALATDRRRSR